MMVPRAAAGYDTSVPKLDITLRDAATGTIGESVSNIWFRYDERVVRADSGDKLSDRAISVRMPVMAAAYDHDAMLVFFDNLLVESDTRAELARLEHRDASDVAGLLGRVGAECAGAIAVWPHDEPRPAPSYRALSTDDVEALFDERHGERLTQAILESQQAMSGAQRKLVLRRDGDRWALPLHGAPSTHLLKRSSGRYDGLVANEIACLRLARQLGLTVPDASAVGGVRDWPDGSCEHRLIAIPRFDRVPDPTRAVTDAVLPHLLRLHQEDLCQITGRRPLFKYQAQGGPTLRDLARVIRLYSATADTDLRGALTAAVANVCLGNGDAHGKNFALLTDREGGKHLSPFYDIVSTDVYPSFTPTFAMSFGHSDRVTGLSAPDLARVAKDFAVAPTLVRTTVETVTTELVRVLDDTLEQVERELGGGVPVLQRVRDLVLERTATLEGLLVRG